MLENSDHLPTIVVRLPNWVGDVCMVMPTLAWLASAGGPIIVCAKPFAKPFAQSILQRNSGSEFIPLSGRILSDSKAIRTALASRRVTRARPEKLTGLIFPDSFTSAATFALAGISSIGYRDDGRSFLLKWPVSKPDLTQHAVLRWHHLACVAAEKWKLPIAGSHSESPPDFLYVPPEDAILEMKASLSAYQLDSVPLVLIAPSATGLHKGKVKVWPGFGELTENLIARGYTVIACPPAHEQDQVRRAAPGARLIEPLSLGAFAQLAKSAALVICNDSGVSHISALVGARQVTLFGVTNPNLTGPWSSRAIRLGAVDAWPTVDTVTEVCLRELQSNLDVNKTERDSDHSLFE